MLVIAKVAMAELPVGGLLNVNPTNHVSALVIFAKVPAFRIVIGNDAPLTVFLNIAEILQGGSRI